MFRSLRGMWAYGAAIALHAPVILQGNTRSRTGGPDPDGDDESDNLRKLMPVLALVITIATVFSD